MSNQDSHKNLKNINSLCSCIEFSGDHCDDFLNNLLISDLKTFNPNTFHYSALCNPKGRIISSLWVNIIKSNHIQLICPKNMLEELVVFFNMRKFRLKINIEVSDIQILMATNGSIFTQPKDENNHTKVTNLNLFYSILFNVNFPWINKENTEKFIPQHVNLDQHDHVMSFKKGCYPGQEIIARMKFLGKIKKRMTVIENASKDELINSVKSQNQVSPIIESNGVYLVQSIEKITDDSE